MTLEKAMQLAVKYLGNLFTLVHRSRVWPEAHALTTMDWGWPSFAVRYRPYDHEHDGA